MDTANETANSLVVQGWEEGVSLERMRTILHENGFMVNSLAILDVWLELDEQEAEKQGLLKV